MKVAFVQNLPVTLDAYSILSACLKEHGIETEVFVFAFEHDICNAVVNSGAGLVAFNTLTGSYNWTLETSKKIKKIKNIPVILGGCHPTLYPETIDFDIVDYICAGEGDDAIVELAEAIGGSGNTEDIKNIAFRKNGNFKLNPLRPLIKDLSILPFPDRKLYHKYNQFRNPSICHYRATRCCPYGCTFCYIKNLSDIYKGQKLFRQYPVKYIIEDLSNMKEDYKNLRYVFFNDEIFGLNKDWTSELLYKYKEKINLPYTITTRADIINDNFIKLLKNTNCEVVNISIETANEKLRNTVLNKKVSNQVFMEAGKKLYEAGIKTRVNCMFCLPDEVLKDAFSNIEFMKKMKATYPVSFLLQPFPKTEIYNYAVKRGYINETEFKVDDLDPFAYFRTPMNIPNKKEIIIVQELFVYACKIPYFDKLLKILIRLPDNLIYRLLHKIAIAFQQKQFYKFSYWRLIKYLFAAIKLDTTTSI